MQRSIQNVREYLKERIIKVMKANAKTKFMNNSLPTHSNFVGWILSASCDFCPECLFLAAEALSGP